MSDIEQRTKFVCFFLLFLLLYSCNRYEGGSFEPAQLSLLSTKELERYADTSRILTHLSTFSNPSKKVDSLLHYAEWVKNYREDISLFYAQMAYDIATENNWSIPRAFSANRLAWSKGNKARFGEDLEDAMVDAMISKRLLADYPDPYWEADINNLFGFLHSKGGEQDSARHYFNKALELAPKLAAQPELVEWNRAMILHNLAATYVGEDPVKELEYYERSDSIFQQLDNKDNQTRLWLDLAQYYTVSRWEPEFADSLLLYCLDYGESNKDIDLLGKAYQFRGFLYQQKFFYFEKENDFNVALKMLRKSLELPLQDAYFSYELLGSCFHDSWAIDVDESHADSAIYYYKLALENASKAGSIAVMQSIGHDLFKLYRYDNYLHKDALQVSIDSFLDSNYKTVVDTITLNAKTAYQRINEVEQRDLRLSTTIKRRNQQVASLAIVLTLLVLFIIFLQRLQNRRLKAEMSALRAQINPHFISNSLNAIENLVNKGNTRAASKYLVHFSRLSRHILNGSASGVVSLAQELKTLKHFLALEQLRFSDKLSYDIEIDPSVDTEAVIIPSMIFQPYVENAIWHGIKPKSEGGHINVFVTKEEKILKCIITDNGIGREEAARRKAVSLIKQKSMGMQITKDRLKSMGKVSGPALQIEDLYAKDGTAAGTKVILRFPYKYGKS
jgi:two-component sensor histidine kinase